VADVMEADRDCMYNRKTEGILFSCDDLQSVLISRYKKIADDTTDCINHTCIIIYLFQLVDVAGFSSFIPVSLPFTYS